jgi:Subtilisin inhibitor-like
VTLLAILVAATSLQITIWPNGEGHTPQHRFTLKCAPVGGTLPNRRTACTKLMAMKNPFAPVRKDLVCTQVYGGPAEAQITGRFRGARVHARFNLRDGCEIGRWNRLRFILGTASKSS